MVEFGASTNTESHIRKYMHPLAEERHWPYAFVTAAGKQFPYFSPSSLLLPPIKTKCRCGQIVTHIYTYNPIDDDNYIENGVE